MGKGKELTFKEKLEIVSYYENLVTSGMKINKEALTEWANVKFDTLVSQMTIGKALKKKDSLTTIDVGHLVDSKRIRKVQCPEVEQTTFSWFTTMQEKGATISDDLLVVATHRFYALQPRDPSEKELQFSHEWVTKFKKRFNMKAYTCHGEDACAETST